MMVCWAAKVTVLTPTDDGAVTAKLLNVFAPVTVRDPATVEVNETLLNVNPPEAIPDVEPVNLIWLVPALNVRLVIVPALNAPADPAIQVMVDAFKLIVLAVDTLETKLVHVTA